MTRIEVRFLGQKLGDWFISIAGVLIVCFANGWLPG